MMAEVGTIYGVIEVHINPVQHGKPNKRPTPTRQTIARARGGDGGRYAGGTGQGCFSSKIKLQYTRSNTRVLRPHDRRHQQAAPAVQGHVS